MKYIFIISSVFMFIQCSTYINKEDLSKDKKVEIDIIVNQDTFYLDETFNAKIFLTNMDSTKKVLNVKFYLDTNYLPHSHDTAKVTFTIKSVNESGIDSFKYRIRAFYTINGILDSIELIKKYHVSKFVFNNRAEGELKNNKREGVWKIWYDNERNYLERISFYKNGLKEGLDSLYYDPFNKNGNSLRSVQNFKAGQKEGFYIEYWENGKISSKGKYKKGIEDGVFIHYSSSGKIIKLR